MQLICITILLSKERTIKSSFINDNCFQIKFLFLLFLFSVAENIRDIMQSALFYQLIECISFVAFSLFALDESMEEINLNTFMSFSALLYAIFSTIIYCYFADRLTADLFEVGDIFYESMWYKLPNQEQKASILSIQRAHRIFRMKCYGIVDCTLDTFTKVDFHIKFCLRVLFLFLYLIFVLIFIDYSNSFIILSYNPKTQVNKMFL